jgi:hypothetical protein
LKVILGNLKDQGDELVTFLELRLGTKPAIEGGELDIEDASIRAGVKPRHVKTYLKRFLYQKGLRKQYRVLVKAKEITLQELEVEEEKKKEEVPKEEKTEAKEEKQAPKEEAEEKEAEEAPKEEEKPKATKKPKAKKAPAKPKKKKET